jgi:SNF2 family DNA or RNA helicase
VQKFIGWTVLSKPAQSFDETIRKRFELVEFERSQMHAYQAEDVEFFKAHPFSYGLISIGLGKTVTAGTLLYDLITNGCEDKILVLGPIAVIATSWPDEFRRWRHLAALDFTVLREDDDDPRIKAAARAARKAGTSPAEAMTAMRRKIRHELARSPAQIHLANFEAIEWVGEFWGREWPYRIVIIDEASLLKSHESTRWNMLKRFRLTEGYITRMHLLTGTPASEGIESFFPLTFLLDGGQRFGKFVTKYRERYFIQNRYSFKLTPREGAVEEVLAKIADITTLRRRQDHFDVKEPLIVQRRVVMRPAEVELYETMQTEFIVKLPDGKEIEAETAAALSQKLAQMASGVLYETALEMPEGYDPDLDDEQPDLVRARRVHPIHDHKIEMLKQIVDELQGEPLLVSYQHRSSLDRLVKAFPKAVKWDKAGKSKAPWNERKIKMLLMHPKSGGHGQNLQKGGSNIVFFDIPWSRDQFAQLIGRLDRQGQVDDVTVFLLVTAGTIDETMAKAQQDKKDAEEEVFKVLRRLIAKNKRRVKAIEEEL